MPASITEEHVAAWRRDGYVVVEDFLTPAEVAQALEDMHAYYPTWDEAAGDPQAHAEVVGNAYALHEFPFRGAALNDLTMHPEVLRFVEGQLGTSDIRLAQSLSWGKYAGTPGLDQALHVDYRNNTLVYPRDEGIYNQIAFILYFTDVTEGLGPTCVVSQAVTGTDVATVTTSTVDDDPRNPPAERRPWYDQEHAVTGRAGALLIYGMRTFHRGTAMTAAEGTRMSLHMVYRSAACPFMGWRSPAKAAHTKEMADFVVRATPRQRELIDFPPPGDPYWNEETLQGVAARYPGIDLTPYR